MTDARWDDQTKSPPIDWHMSAALQDVPRGDEDVAEVTSLERAVRAWLALDPQHQEDATLTPERPVLMEGVSHDRFRAEGIAALGRLLPTNTNDSSR